MPDRTFTIMTANVGAGLASAGKIEEAIRIELPDIVAFEELPRDRANQLRTSLADQYAHTAFIADGNEGRGILSRFPIPTFHPLEVASGRPDVTAVIEVGGHDLTVVVAHPRPQQMSRTGLIFPFSSLRQLVHLGRHTVDAAPAVLLGDLNMSPRHPGYRRLKRLGLRDAWEEKGKKRGSTFPTRIGYTRFSGDRLAQRKVPPFVRFDYIWCTAEISVLDAWIGPDTGSDHATVLARLRLPDR